MLDREALHDEREAEPVRPRRDGQRHAQALLRRGRRTALIAIRQRVVLEPAECGAMHGLAVEQDLKLERRLKALEPAHGARGGLPELGPELVLAVDGEVVLDDEPAARAERQPLDPAVLRQIGRGLVVRRVRLDGRVADGRGRDLQRDGEIALEQQRRSLEHIGDVVEAVARAIGRQQRLDVDRHAEQVADRVAVLGAVQAMQGLAPRLRRGRRGGIELPFEIGDETRGRCRVGPRAARRRHEAKVELVDHLLPHGGIRGRDAAGRRSRARGPLRVQRRRGTRCSTARSRRRCSAASCSGGRAAAGGEQCRGERRSARDWSRRQRHRAAVAAAGRTGVPSRAPSSRNTAAAAGLCGGAPNIAGERPSA